MISGFCLCLLSVVVSSRDFLQLISLPRSSPDFPNNPRSLFLSPCRLFLISPGVPGDKLIFNSFSPPPSSRPPAKGSSSSRGSPQLHLSVSLGPETATSLQLSAWLPQAKNKTIFRVLLLTVRDSFSHCLLKTWTSLSGGREFSSLSDFPILCDVIPEL